VLHGEHERVTESRVVLMCGRQIDLVEAGMCDRIDDLFAERQNELRWEVRRPGRKLYQVAQLLVRCNTNRTEIRTLGYTRRSVSLTA